MQFVSRFNIRIVILLMVLSKHKSDSFFSCQVRKSILASDKNSSGPSGGGTKSHLAKGPATTIGSPPNPKIREAA